MKYAYQKYHTSAKQKGYLLILVLGITIVLMTLTLGIMSVISTKYAKTADDVSGSNAIYTAEAGISDTLAQLNLNSSFTGYTTKKQFFNDSRGKGEYTTSIADNGNGTLTITSVAYMSHLSTDTTPFMTRTLKALILETKTPVLENVVAGAAGLDMSGSFFPWFGQQTAMTKGMVYSRGKITLNGSATSIGTSTDSARVTAANIGCGNTSNWPQPCATNDPPLVLSGSSFFYGGSASIYGSVCATNQTSSTNIYPGPTGNGLQQGCVAPDYGLPFFDKSAFTNRQVIPIAPIPPATTCLFTGGAPVWVDHSRILGDVNLSSSFGNCTVTLLGDVYIKGNLTLGAKSRINVSNLLGNRRPTIVVNGTVTLQSDAGGIFANSSGTPLTIISFSSNNTSKSNDDNFSSPLTSSELYNSSVIPSNYFFSYGATRAITLGDTDYSGADTADYSGVAVYSYYGSTLYALSNSHSMRGIGGQSVSISPGGTFSFTGGNLSITDTSPFSWILGRTKYVLGDYLQSYP